MNWAEIELQRRWMPLGRPEDAKAPAPGYRTNQPDGWMLRRDVNGAMAGVNFGFGGLLGLDFDMKPDLLEDAGPIWEVFRTVLQALPGPVERSYSGNGAHLFAIPDAALEAELRQVARKPYVLEWHKGDKGWRPAAAVELFGCGNAYIAVTDHWLKSRMPSELPVISGDLLWAVLDALPVKEKPKTRKGRSGAGAPKSRDSAYDKLMPVLAQLPVPGEYMEWLGMVSSLKAAGFSQMEVEDWSSNGPAYKAGEVYLKWDHTLSEYTAGTAIAAAQDAGLIKRRFIPVLKPSRRMVEVDEPAPPPSCAVCRRAGGDLVKGSGGDYMLCQDPQSCAANCRENQAELIA